MTLLEWLDKPYQDRKIIDRVAELVWRNGGRLTVHGWGIFHNGFGLDQNDALELIELNGIIIGFMAAENEMHRTTFQAMVQERIDRKEAALKAEWASP